MASKSFDKLIQEIGNMSVLDLADFVKELKETFNVSDVMPMMSGPAAAAPGESAQAAAQEEKSEYKVTLQDGGPEKIKTIKALRQVTTLSLTDAKKAVEEAPTVIAEAASKDDAKKMKETLEAAGAKVQLA